MPERKAFPLRVDPALWAAVERCATANIRSANAEAECLLREALKARVKRGAAAAVVRRERAANIVACMCRAVVLCGGWFGGKEWWWLRCDGAVVLVWRLDDGGYVMFEVGTSRRW